MYARDLNEDRAGLNVNRNRIVNLGAAAALVSLAATGAVWAADAPTTCTTCHASQHTELDQSVHKALHCTECHGGEKAYTVAPPELARYLVAAGATRPGFEHGGTFSGKPDRTKIPQLCGDCHANIERMNPYGIRTDQLARYWTSGHGKTLLDKKDTRVAVCVDCHGVHDILKASEPSSKTNAFNVPDTCGRCHADKSLMGDYKLPTEIVDEYRHSVHGTLLFDQKDSGAPTCATCHGNHSAVPPGFASVGAVCGQCHQHASTNFATSIHATQAGHKGCVQCHGGGEGKHFHAIERITKPTGVMIQRYAHLMASGAKPTAAEVTAAIHSEPKQILTHALPTCTECHEAIGEDKSLPKLFGLLDEIASAERYYVETGHRLDEVGQGVLLVDNQRFRFEDAKTHLIALAPLQHTLDNTKVAEKVKDLRTVCDQVNKDLDQLQTGLEWRYRALGPIWAFAVGFAAVLYVKYKSLRVAYVRPLPKG